MSQRIVLVDGSSYLFRAYHALPHLTNKQGEHTGAIYGVVNMLQKLPETYETAYVVVIFDASGKNFRHELFPDYKANRKQMADELRQQISPIHEIVQKMGFPVIKHPGVEADDVIGTLSKKLTAQGYSVLISTGDKDMAQLVDEHVTLVDTMKNRYMAIPDVHKTFGVGPEQMNDYLALMGDSSDNIPGIPTVGPKTAAKWLNQYQNIEGIINNADQIKGKIGEKLRAHLDQLALSKELARIRCDIPIDVELAQLKCQQPDRDFLQQEFTRYELKRLLPKWGKQADQADSVASESHEAFDFEVIISMETLKDHIATMTTKSVIAVDCETDRLDALNATLVGVSVAYQANHGIYIPFAHQGTTGQLSYDDVLSQMQPVFANQAITKVFHNAKFDLKVFARYQVYFEGVADTMLLSYVYNSSESRHDMNTLAKRYLNKTPITFESIAGRGKAQKTFDQIDLNQAGEYAAEDAAITYQLYQYLWPEVQAVPALKDVYHAIEMPLCFVLNRMETIGVCLDVAQLAKQDQALLEQMALIEQQCYELAGTTFNLASTKQLRHVLYEQMGLPVIKKTPGGVASTSEEVLQQLAESYPLAERIMTHRHISKLQSTYTAKLPKLVDPQTQRIHTSYHQAIAITGRLSSSDPNLQNIPIRSEVGRKIRQAFTARPGYVVLAADYSQVELRIMAHLSKDATLLNAFQKQQDIHAITAAEIFGQALSDVTSEQRRRAKAINFGLIYGMGAYGLAKQLNISRGQAQDYVHTYFQRYPGVKAYMDHAKAQAKSQGYVTTLSGRRLHLPEIYSRNNAKQRGAERAAINGPMQGSAADIIKKAMIDIDAWQQAHADQVAMVMQVHDELIFEVEKAFVQQAKAVIQDKMMAAADLDVPLEVDIGVGDNWGQAH